MSLQIIYINAWQKISYHQLISMAGLSSENFGVCFCREGEGGECRFEEVQTSRGYFRAGYVEELSDWYVLINL